MTTRTTIAGLVRLTLRALWDAWLARVDRMIGETKTYWEEKKEQGLTPRTIGFLLPQQTSSRVMFTTTMKMEGDSGDDGTEPFVPRPCMPYEGIGILDESFWVEGSKGK